MKRSVPNEDLVYEAALRLEDPTSRRLFLDQACAGDPGLRTAVEEMLLDQGEADRFFSRGEKGLRLSVESFQDYNGEAPLNGDGRVKLPEDKQIGHRIGRYKVLEKIGEGGCGWVYLAEQQEPVRRSVALKIIKLGMDTKSLVARFEAERQVLALMDHPNIARALDAGATEAGRPYFVMELVRGEKITNYCDQQRLEIRQRLELFIQICHAIQHAHQKGIIHRDIKPSNILVTVCDGVALPKVIDFGIAKAITGEPLTNNTVFTVCEQFLGTPAYMSPEQAQGGMDVDTRSDIYSLGVLLYELLTGHTPFDGQKLLESSMEELQRTLREKEPPRPSAMIASLATAGREAVARARGVEADRLAGIITGDLDWIVMKALEKDRGRRYETAHEVALDIARYLKGEAVLASPPGRIYLLRKLIRRNKGTFVAVGAVMGTLLLGMGTSSFLYFEERLARQEAERDKAVESAYRIREEAANHITQAAYDIEAGKYYEAAGLVRLILPENISPTTESARVYREIGTWYATNQQWGEASALFVNLLHVNEFWNYNSAAAAWDPLAAGTSLLEAGDDQHYAAYLAVRDSVIKRFAGTADPLVAERLIRTSLLVPTSRDTLAALEIPFRTVESSLNGAGTNDGSANPEAAWRPVALALMDLRSRRWQPAVERCRSILAKETNSPARAACARVVLGVASRHLENANEGAGALELARQAINNQFHGGLPTGNARDGYWFDWAMAQILLREAGGTAKSTPGGG